MQADNINNIKAGQKKMKLLLWLVKIKKLFEVISSIINDTDPEVDKTKKQELIEEFIFIWCINNIQITQKLPKEQVGVSSNNSKRATKDKNTIINVKNVILKSIIIKKYQPYLSKISINNNNLTTCTPSTTDDDYWFEYWGQVYFMLSEFNFLLPVGASSSSGRRSQHPRTEL